MINTDLGAVTAYAYAVSKGFEGTEEEFAEFMANCANISGDVSELKSTVDDVFEALGAETAPTWEAGSINTATGNNVTVTANNRIRTAGYIQITPHINIHIAVGAEISLRTYKYNNGYEQPESTGWISGQINLQDTLAAWLASHTDVTKVRLVVRYTDDRAITTVDALSAMVRIDSLIGVPELREDVRTLERIAPQNAIELLYGRDSGITAINQGYSSQTTGAVITGNSSYAYVSVSTEINGSRVYVQMTDDKYSYYIAYYSGVAQQSNFTGHTEPLVPGTALTYLDASKGVRATINFVLTSGPAAMDADDRVEIVSKRHIYVRTLPDTTLSQAGEAADAKAVGDALEVIDGRIYYDMDPDALKWSYGGLLSTGANIVTKKAIRLIAADGSGAFPVLAGSKITANTGYQFNVAMYSRYHSYTNFDLLEFRSKAAGEYVIPSDCLIRLSVYADSNDDLWVEDDEGLRTFTEAGIDAQDGVTLNLIGGSVKQEIAKLASAVTGSNILTLPDLPLNAVDYHVQWNALVEAGEATRTLLGKVNNSDSLPVYLYTIRAEMNHIDSDYDMIPWDGTNEIFHRPKVLLTGGVHGNERLSPTMLLDFVDHILHDTRYRHLLNVFDWYIIPLVNPWGYSNSATDNDTGKQTNGSSYGATKNISHFTVTPNTVNFHYGIRRNLAGDDINRDFGSGAGDFSTPEAGFVRDAVYGILGDGEQFAFAMDCHQAVDGGVSTTEVVGAFISPGSTNITEAKRSHVFNRWMQAGAVTEKLIADYTDKEVRQCIYPWGSQNVSESSSPLTNTTLRAWLHSMAEYSMCFEGAQNCVYYSGSSTRNNPVARALVNTQFHGFIERFMKDWM